MADNFNNEGAIPPPSGPFYAAAAPVPGQVPMIDPYYGYGSSALTPVTLLPGSAPCGIAMPVSGAPGEPTASIPALCGAGSFYFSFCGTDGLMVGDPSETNQSVMSLNGATTPMARPATPSTPAPGSGQAQVNAETTPTPMGVTRVSTTSLSLLSGAQLPFANHESFLGIPTPSAPNRNDYPGSSQASNCSSGSQYKQQQHNNESVTSLLGVSSGSGPSSQQGDGSNVVQKDVLALMAAEQHQQKFVLQQRNVYMSGLPVNFRPSAFRAMCGVFGRIESSKLCMEADDSSRCRGFGFVLFYDVDSANSCISSLNGKMMQGRTLQVRRADLSAAPQPLHPITQRNRTGSGLVSPPLLGTMAGGATQATIPPPPPANTAFPFYAPHPPATMPVAANPVVISSLPFTFATPGVGGVTTPVQMVATNKSLSTTSSYTVNNNASVSSSLGATATPTVVYASNSSIVQGVRAGMPMMQLFTAMPAGSAPGGMVPQPPPQSQQTSLGSRDGLTPHPTTPASLASSSNPAGLSGAATQPQNAVAFDPQPPVQPPMQPQRPVTAGARIPVYNGFESITSPANTNLSHSGGSGAAPAMPGVVAPASMPALQSCYSANGGMIGEYYLAADPNTSASNVFYFIPQ